MNQFGFVRVSVCSPEVAIGNPQINVKNIIDMLRGDDIVNSQVVVFPELCISAYTCADLFEQTKLLKECEQAIKSLCWEARLKPNKLIFVGAPIPFGNSLYNCAVVVNNSKILGIVPKTYIPNYKEFYESRWFKGFTDNHLEKNIAYCGQFVPFGTDILFRQDELIVGVEICEDLWGPIPPSSFQALAGANLLVNLSASNETVGKAEYRTDLVKNQSGRCVAAYAYASAGPSESTDDVVFGGHCLIAENGRLLVETKRVGHPDEPVQLGARFATVDIDIQKLQTERRSLISFGQATSLLRNPYRMVNFTSTPNFGLKRKIDGTPFVPKDPAKLKNRCAEVFGNQCCGLVGRLRKIHGGQPVDSYIGISGGLDSTLALLVVVKTYDALRWDRKHIHGITMPGFGTTNKTKENAKSLMTKLGIDCQEINIAEGCMRDFVDLKHNPFGIDCDTLSVEEFLRAIREEVPKEKRADLTFENVQARKRTFFLMSKGFTIGTGDMSEIAEGWCTYNGDHMSNYNPNCGVPKTLVKFLVQYVAETEYCSPNGCDKTYDILMSIVNTTISPELLPMGKDGEIEQSTEDSIGPFELIDFYLPDFMLYGFSPEKMLYLAEHADFTKEYAKEMKVQTLKTFLTKFFTQHWKKLCVPCGSKVGSVSLSPRGDWRMPSDADYSIWLKGIQ